MSSRAWKGVRKGGNPDDFHSRIKKILIVGNQGEAWDRKSIRAENLTRGRISWEGTLRSAGAPVLDESDSWTETKPRYPGTAISTYKGRVGG